MASGGNSATVFGSLKGLGSVPPCPPPHGTDSTLPRVYGLSPSPVLAEGKVPWAHSPMGCAGRGR